MKKLLVTTLAVLICLTGSALSQVIADFEEDLGGFYDANWGPGVTSIAQVSDPTGESGGVMQVDLTCAKDAIVNADGINPGDANVITFFVHLPAEMPDSLLFQVFAQDDANWGWVTYDYNTGDIPREVWYPISFDMEAATVDTNKNFSSEGNNLGKTGIQILCNETDDDTSWTGTFYLDNVSLIGAKPSYISQFDSDLGGFVDADWGPGISEINQVTSPARGESEGSMEISLTCAKDAISNAEGLNPGDNQILTYFVYIPKDVPDSLMLQLFAQDDANWGWVTTDILTANIPREVWHPINFDMLANTVDPDKNFSIDGNNIGKTGIQVICQETDDDTSWSGNIYLDDVSFNGSKVALPPIEAVELTVTPMEEVDVQGETHFYNLLEYNQLTESHQESYDIYFSESEITDVNGEGVHHLHSLSRVDGEASATHGIFSMDGTGQKTYHYAITVSDADSTAFDSDLSTGSATNNCTDMLDIPLLSEDDFDFAADGDISEFEAVAENFPDMVMKPQFIAGADTAFVYSRGNENFDFTGYLVMTDKAMYWGFHITDDEPGADQAWAGDGIDPYFGLFDIHENPEIMSGFDASTGYMRLGIAARADNKLQWSGYQDFTACPGTEVTVTPEGFGSNSFFAEWKVNFDSLATFEWGGSQCIDFTPADEMVIPFKLDVNDQDTISFDIDNIRRAHQEVIGVPEAVGWPNPVGWAARAVITDESMTTGLEDEQAVLPESFKLSNAYPNPFNPTTHLSYQLPKNEKVVISIYNILGEKVATLVDKKLNAGKYTTLWNGKDMRGKQVSSGIYFCRMRAGNFVKIRKLTLMK